MATFDEWNVPQNSLMHFRTKGSKNGVRRFQNRDGTWTPLGLQQRKAREGWGDKKAAKYDRKAQRYARLMNRPGIDTDTAAKYGKRVSLNVLKRNYANGAIDRKEYREILKAGREEDRIERRNKRQAIREAAAERMHKNSLKGLSDAELQQKINRLKMEQEYKELSKSPLLKAGESLVKSYFEAKEKKMAREEKKIQMENNRLNAQANLIKAKAQKAEAKNEFISQITGASRKKAKAELKKVKNEERKNTVRGAISSSLGNVIRKKNAIALREMENKKSYTDKLIDVISEDKKKKK